MDTYRVITERAGVPELTDLRAAYVDEPGPVEGGRIVFDADYTLDPRYVQIDRAAGALCEVVRIRDGHESRKRGSVRSINPLTVDLNGGRWE